MSDLKGLLEAAEREDGYTVSIKAVRDAAAKDEALIQTMKGTIAGLQADYDSRMEDLREADNRIAELEAFIVAEVDPFSLRPIEREKWYDLHKKLHPENYR